MKGFTSYIKKFMDQADLLPLSGSMALAISGGRDSMGLLHVLVDLRKKGLIKELRAFHVNHGTRPGNTQEEELVINFCQMLGVSLKVFHPNFNLGIKNFEHVAREKRYELFLKELEGDEVLLTAHHIDDSFEWSLLKQFKSGTLSAALGIPVKNGRIRRPFNCVTRKQIAQYVKLNKIPFIHDSSNESIRFERNYLRETIIPSIKKRFPNYLKHYVHRANQQALKLDVSVLIDSKINFELLIDPLGILISHPQGKNDFRGCEEQIIQAISKLSEKKRGTLHTQVAKIIQAAMNGKKGPLLFSGNVLGLINQGSLYFMAQKSLEQFKQLDEDLLNSLKNKKIEFAPISYEKLKHGPKGLVFPFLTFAKDMPNNFPSLKKQHPLFPKSTEYGLKSGLWINTLPKLLFYWERGSRIQLKESFNILKIS